MQPYPYGDGYHRDSTSCNTDNPITEGLNVFKATSLDTPTGQYLHSLLVPSGAKEKCVSPFGVQDLPGNLDEWVRNPAGHYWKGHPKGDRGPYISGLVGGHVFGVRNACRPMTDGHGEEFVWYETGFRGCADGVK